MNEAHFKLLRLIESRPDLTQRELARELGVSLGKVNYCVNVLIEHGWIKVLKFCNSRNKFAYTYLLTPEGIRQKTTDAKQFLRRKVVEYERLDREIAQLRRDVDVAPEHKPQ